MRRWRGLVALVVDAVDHGSRAVERVHMNTAKVPFDILERIPPLALPARVVHVAHDAIAGFTYGAVRAVSRGVGAGVDLALEVVEDRQGSEEPPRRGA